MKEKLKNILIWVLLVGYSITALSLTNVEYKNVRVSGVKVRIDDNTHNKFISESDIIDVLNKENINIIDKHIDSVNIHYIENILQHQNKSIRHAEVFRTVYGELDISIEQRQPIMRIVNRNGDSYYIDKNGQVMPLSKKYTAHVIIASGYLNEPYMDHVGENMKQRMSKKDKSSGEIIPDLFRLVQVINNNKFWRSQFEQIYINSDGDIELVPRIGNHVIIIGTVDNLTEKFENLEAFYEQGLSRYGWNKYKTISLKYKNQIVCTKRI